MRTEISTAVEGYQRFTISMDYMNPKDMDTERKEEGGACGEEKQMENQWLLVANRNVDHYQSLEDLRKVSLRNADFFLYLLCHGPVCQL